MKKITEILGEMLGTEITVRGETATIEFDLRGELNYTGDGVYLLSMENPNLETGMNQFRFMESDVKSAIARRAGGRIWIKLN